MKWEDRAHSQVLLRSQGQTGSSARGMHCHSRRAEEEGACEGAQRAGRTRSRLRLPCLTQDSAHQGERQWTASEALAGTGLP